MRVLKWNGRDVPAELRKLPPGQYAVESIDRVPRLTSGEEAGLEEALASLARGEGIAASRVHAEFRSILRKAAATRRKRRTR